MSMAGIRRFLHDPLTRIAPGVTAYDPPLRLFTQLAVGLNRPEFRGCQPLICYQPFQPVEKVEADVSTRSVEVTTGFTGHEILVFGAIDHSQQPEETAPHYYDVVAANPSRS